MGTFLIVLGVSCLYFFLTTAVWLYIPLGIGFIAWGVHKNKEKKRKKTVYTNTEGSGCNMVHGMSYIGVYDDDGNFINVESGGFTQGLDGRYRDNYGHTVERDSDGEYRLL
ncbi:MAG: hypothetical protein IJ447_04295 [Clostridia bacterium]|nr:hypothetical protein [Clostridia bacterium]